MSSINTNKATRRWFREATASVQRAQTNLPLYLLCLVLGFFAGNLAGTFLVDLRRFVPSDLLIICLIGLLFESISAYAYQPSSAMASQVTPQARFGPSLVLTRRIFNLTKMGCLFGFFVDSFKVGS